LTTPSQAETSYRRSYPQSSKAVGRARRDVVDFAQRQCGFSGQPLADIEVAVGEGLANAVEHGNADESGFEVSVRRDAHALIVEIKDRGHGFDPENMYASAQPAVEALRGFGKYIMRELMDEVRYTDRGTRLQLLKRLPAGAADERSAVRA
jgi:serine/threonine-protein kinase RsbW/non-specific serine/threonine protein kinase